MTEINRVDARTLKFWLDSNQAIIIDVREPDEYKEGYIKGAVNIPLSQILTEIDHVDGCRDKKIVMQCKTGVRSMVACQNLKKDGFKHNMWNLDGGIYAWQKAGFSISI
jgi:rhodanese-related sulfurtransferase